MFIVLAFTSCNSKQEPIKSFIKKQDNNQVNLQKEIQKQKDLLTKKKLEEELERQKQQELEKQKELRRQKQQELEKEEELRRQKQTKIVNSVYQDFNNKIDNLWKTLNKSEIVYDKSTNLTWQDDFDAKSIKLEWNAAKNYCNSLNFIGKKDWYLPTIDELKTILDKSGNNNHKKDFKNTVNRDYWSSSSNLFYSGPIWNINFKYGKVDSKGYWNNSHVRCVRKGQLACVTLENSKKYKLYQSANGKKKISKKVHYAERPFKEIETLTQELISLYLEPKKIPKDILHKINKPYLPTFIKSEYETKYKFKQRLNNEIQKLQVQYRKDVENRNKIITKLSREIEAEQKYKTSVLTKKIKEFQKNTLKIVMGGFKFKKRSYDAETGTMYVTMKANKANYSKKISLKVSPQFAKSFSEHIKDVKVNPVFEFTNNLITLKSINANYNNNTYLAVLDKKNFKSENITVVIKETKVKFDSTKQIKLSLQNPNLKDTYQVEALVYKDGEKIKGQNFDDDIPSLLSKIKSTKVDNKKWLFTIGIENYNETDNIKYSKRSAELFKKVAKKALGIKERNCYTLINGKATGTAIKNKLRLLLSEVKKGDTVYFYYNGHGIPDPSKDGEPYILPSDGIPDFIISEKEFSLKNIYKQLSDSKASKVVAFVDSCFSGATDGVSIIKGVAGSRLAPKKVIFDKSKMVVLTAGQKKQYSNMYQEKGHRMFSYFVMRSLLAGKKDINMLYKEVSYKTSEASNELGALKKQEPTLDGNIKIKL